MGEVFRARDTKLGRDVAIKVLPAALAQDAERVGRFRREAQILATLNHSNIASIYGLEEADGAVGLVMELVAGDDLAQRLRTGAIPVDEAITIAGQIAEALEEAHEHGIVHRDLKPANIKVTPDGKVKVLDFGLAKALEGETGSSADSQLSHSPTMSRHATEAGLILGTAAYMSPEQARGRAVDKRADIWSFGVVLFEMLTGQRLFSGETVSDTLAAVLREEVPWTRLPPRTPGTVVQLLRRCFVRDPRLRLRDIGEARLALVSAPLDDAGSTSPRAAARASSLTGLGITIAAAAITGAVVWQARAPRTDPELRLAILAPTQAPPQAVRISPDASSVAILADDKVWLRRLDGFSATAVSGSEGARAIFWSPDSTHVGFQAREQLWRVGVSGASPMAIGPVPGDFTPAGGAAWFKSGKIIFATGTSTLLEMEAKGGAGSRPVLELDPAKDIDVHGPAALPDDRGVLFVNHPTDGPARGTVQIWTEKERKTLFPGSGALASPTYSPTGHILFDMNGSVWAAPFSLGSLSSAGDPVLVAEAARSASVADDGTIVMLSGTASTAMRLTSVDSTGRPGSVISTLRAATPRISPDGRLVASSVGSGSDADIWIFDLVRGTERRLTFEPGADSLPTWSPDGRFVVYGCGPAVCAMAADGSGSRTELVARARSPVVTTDGRRLAFLREDGIVSVDIGAAGLSAPLTADPRLVTAPRAARTLDVSPNGRFVAYDARDNGTDAVFVTTFPVALGKWEIPVRLAVSPRWSPKGDRLFVFDELSRIVEVPVDVTGAFSAGRPEIRIPAIGSQRANGYDVSRDGKTFLIPLPQSATDTQTRILIIRNWRPR